MHGLGGGVNDGATFDDEAAEVVACATVQNDESVEIFGCDCGDACADEDIRGSEVSMGGVVTMIGIDWLRAEVEEGTEVPLWTT
jgi:hypothetical protein